MEYNLDITQEYCESHICKQYDNRTININVLNNGQAYDLSNKTLILNACNSKGNIIIQTNDITKSGNVATIQLSDSMTEVSGTLSLELCIKEGEKQITTFTFKIDIRKSVLNKGNADTTVYIDVIEILTDKILEAQTVKAETEQLIASGGAATKGEVQNLSASLDTKARKEIVLGSNKITSMLEIDNYTDVVPIVVHSNVLFGYKNNTTIVKSYDEGITWEDVAIINIGSVHTIIPCNNGYLIGTNNKVYKFKDNVLTEKLTKSHPTGVGILPWGIDGDGEKFIITEYSGADRSESRYVWISTDGGNTFNVVVDKNTIDPTHTSHMHAVCYDKWNDRFWLSHGHGVIRGMYFSEDNGATWNKINGFTPDACPTTLTATPYGIIAGSDSNVSGLYSIPNTIDNKLEMFPIARWVTEVDGVVGFSLISRYDEYTGNVYVCFKSQDVKVKNCIMIGNCSGGDVVWQYNTYGEFHFNSFVPTENYILATILKSGTKTFLKGLKPKKVLSKYDNGNINTGYTEMPSSIAIGQNVNVKTSNDIVVGNNSKVKDGSSGTFGVTIGENCEGNTRSITIGRNSKSNYGDSISIGDTISGKGTEGVIIGKNNTGVDGSTRCVAIGSETSSNSYSVAIGYQARNGGGGSTVVGKGGYAGTNSLALGNNASAGTQQIAIGNGARAQAGLGSVAIGDGVETTQPNQVALGNTHISLGAIEVCPDSSQGTIHLYAKLNIDNKLELRAKLRDADILIATQS